MALIKCPECGKEISNNAKTCPNCGHRLKPSAAIPILLTIAGILSILLAAFFLTPYIETASLNPSDYLLPEHYEEETKFLVPHLIVLIISCISLIAALLQAINIKMKSRPLAISGIIASSICFILLAYGFTLTTEFFLFVPFVCAPPLLSLIGGCLSLKHL